MMALLTSLRTTLQNVGFAPISVLSKRSFAAATAGSLKSTLADHNGLKLLWNDGKSTEVHNIWLRDNCPCHVCRHKDTEMKLLDTAAIPIDIKATATSVEDPHTLNVKWSDGHESTYSASWLSSVFNGKTTPVDNEPTEVPTILWDKSTMDALPKGRPETAYDEIMAGKPGLRKWLTQLHQYGVAVITGVPTNHRQVTELAKRIAYVKETSYGEIFDVLSEPDPKAHLAFKPIGLDFHTDMNYRENSPGIQLLHCLQTATIGGDSQFVDGFFVADWLRKTSPIAFQVLSSADVRFAIRSKDAVHTATTRVIVTDKRGALKEVHLNNRTLQPLQLPKELVVPFYEAYKAFNLKVRDPASELRFRLQPGECVSFNNRRCLHARTAFDPMSGRRHLQGCYVDYDEFHSKLNLLNYLAAKDSL
eukprot:Colp12_sorted_trinity150504_noHs@30642